MDDDIVERLRKPTVRHTQVSGDWEEYATVARTIAAPKIQQEAADEIERLRAALAVPVAANAVGAAAVGARALGDGSSREMNFDRAAEFRKIDQLPSASFDAWWRSTGEYLDEFWPESVQGIASLAYRAALVAPAAAPEPTPIDAAGLTLRSPHARRSHPHAPPPKEPRSLANPITPPHRAFEDRRREGLVLGVRRNVAHEPEAPSPVLLVEAMRERPPARFAPGDIGVMSLSVSTPPEG